MYERILLPLGRDHEHEPLLDHALELATTYHARLHLVHVSDRVDQSQFADEEEGPAEAGRAILEEARQAAQEAGVDVETAIVEGKPYEAIVDNAEEVDADLIVMGTHGKKGLTRMLLGSTAEEVLRRSLIPVLTVRE